MGDLERLYTPESGSSMVYFSWGAGGEASTRPAILNQTKALEGLEVSSYIA